MAAGVNGFPKMGAVTCCVSEVFAAAADRPPQRATAQAIPAAVLRPRTGPKSGPTRGTPSSEANRHETTPAPFDHHMPNIARVYPRVLPPESNSPLPQFPSVRRPSSLRLWGSKRMGYPSLKGYWCERVGRGGFKRPRKCRSVPGARRGGVSLGGRQTAANSGCFLFCAWPH